LFSHEPDIWAFRDRTIVTTLRIELIKVWSALSAKCQAPAPGCEAVLGDSSLRHIPTPVTYRDEESPLMNNVIIHPRSTNRTTPYQISAIGYAIGQNLWVWCIMHQLWNLHGLAPKCEVAEPDGTFFILDESEPGTIAGRKPHNDHPGEFWIECCGFASLEIRRRIRARKPPTETN
jgi:hypothetical protein